MIQQHLKCGNTTGILGYTTAVDSIYLSLSSRNYTSNLKYYKLFITCKLLWFAVFQGDSTVLKEWARLEVFLWHNIHPLQCFIHEQQKLLCQWKQFCQKGDWFIERNGEACRTEEKSNKIEMISEDTSGFP